MPGNLRIASRIYLKQFQSTTFTFWNNNAIFLGCISFLCKILSPTVPWLNYYTIWNLDRVYRPIDQYIDQYLLTCFPSCKNRKLYVITRTSSKCIYMDLVGKQLYLISNCCDNKKVKKILLVGSARTHCKVGWWGSLVL